MTLNDAILELQLKGLPYPSPFSVLFLYQKIGAGYCRTPLFDNNFRELLDVQKTIQRGNLHSV